MHNKPKTWIAVFIALFTPALAMMYVGKRRFALLYFLILLLIVCGTFYFRDYPIITLLTQLIYLIIGTTHSYKIAKRFPDNGTRPPYSRWYYLASIFFAFVAITFLIRSYTFEPFNAPSASMNPTIPPKSLLVVQKWGYGNYGSYGFKLYRTKMTASVQRGDILAFEFPNDRKFTYVKRVIGMPGDRVEYREKRLSINGQQIATRKVDEYEDFHNSGEQTQIELYEEHSTAGGYQVIIDLNRPPILPSYSTEFAYVERCQFDDKGFTCTVPDEHYFMMGDNRDNSNDSRYWGFLPATHIIGKVIFIQR